MFVEWIDSTSTNGWHSTDSPNVEASLLNCETIGFLIQKTKDVVLLSQNRNNGPQVGELMAIPRIAIKRMVEVKYRG